MSVLNVSMNTYKERRNQMEIQIITETKAIYMPFAPVNKLSADEYNEMRKMLAEAEALGVIRDWSIYQLDVRPICHTDYIQTKDKE